MSRWKPQVSYITDSSLYEWLNSSRYIRPPKSKYVTRRYDTYAELKKNLKWIVDVNIDDDGVHVVRSRRGQWGEWFEHWKNVDGKPTIVKEGWS